MCGQRVALLPGLPSFFLPKKAGKPGNEVRQQDYLRALALAVVNTKHVAHSPEIS